MTRTELMITLWEEGRTRLANLLPGITTADLSRRLHPRSNSLGWLLRHIGEVEHLFAKNVFGETIDVRVSTIGGFARDHGQFNDLGALLAYLEDAHRVLRAAFEKQTDLDWETYIETLEFGRKSKAEALARISTHTAWHAGQVSLILKYGV